MNPPSLWPLPESNRHTIRYKILSFACLPISTKGPFFLLRRPDSNGEYKCQKLGCYHYTTAHHILSQLAYYCALQFDRLLCAQIVCCRQNRNGHSNRCAIQNHLNTHINQLVKTYFRFHCLNFYREQARAVG